MRRMGSHLTPSEAPCCCRSVTSSFVSVLPLAVLRWRSNDFKELEIVVFKELEIVVLQHELGILGRRPVRR